MTSNTTFTRLEPTAKVIFISHAGVDKPRLGPYLQRLLERTEAIDGPVYLWIDRPGEVGWPAPGPTVGRLASEPRVLGLQSTVAWLADIAAAVAKSDCVVVIYSHIAAPEKSSIFATEILTALFDKKCVTISLDPIRRPEKPDILLQFIQWIDVSRFTSTTDDGAFDRAIDEVIKLVSGAVQTKIAQAVTRPAIDVEKFASVVKLQRSREMQLLSNGAGLEARIVDRKYIPEVFVERSELSVALQRFAASDGQTFVLLGDAGMGKTSFLCGAANDFGITGFALFYLAIELHSGLKSAIIRDLKEFVGEESLADRLSMLAKEATHHGKRFTIFLDGLNETPGDRQKLRAELNELVRETEGSGLQWIISCRALDWDYWLRNDNNMIGRFGRSVWSERNDSTASAVVTQFNDEEFGIAWQKYESEFKLVGHLSLQLRALCSEPFMLRLVSEVYRDGKPLPVDINAMEIFDRYFSERFPDQEQLFAVRKFLIGVAKRTLVDGMARIDVVTLTTDEFSLCQKLIKENVLVRRGDTHLNFRFELVLEYILAKWIMSTIPVNADSADQVRLLLEVSGSPSINRFGAIENVLLLWQKDDAIVLAVLEKLVLLSDDRWKIMSCSVLRKFDRFPRNGDRVVGRLAADKNFIVRRYLVQTLVRHSSEVSSVIRGLQEDPLVWERREIAASWLRLTQSLTSSAAIDELLHIGNDPHWRVRRAAGYAMHGRWCADGGTRSDIAVDIGRFSWRQRHALCIGLIGSPAASGTPEGDAVEALSMDDNHQVRWMVANYLTRYTRSHESATLQRLAADTDEWVRGRMAAALISMDDLERSTPTASAALRSLTNDPAPAVRIRIARDLAKAAGEPWATSILTSYLSDAPEVAFAAAYTLEGAPNKNGIDLFGDDALAESEAHFWILRERIARGEVDPKTSRFGPLQDEVSRTVALPAESDRYMRILDSMTSLISAAAEWLTLGPLKQSRFFDVLCEDIDESVRWALVLYLASFADDSVTATEKLRIFAQLADDPHFWVRREVALALGRWDNVSIQDEKIKLLKRMWSSELASSEACKDEVLHYLKDALDGLASVSLGKGTWK